MPSSLVSVGVLALVVSASATPYSLLHNFDSSNFFQNFSLTTDTDPTHGFVEYVDYNTAHNSGLASVKSGNVYLGVDHTNTYSSGGRPSTRVESNVYFDHGLLIADFAHMPAGACGVWPAFWTVGKSWPADGEIDIIEGVNNQANNQMALHTQGDCQITSKDQTGSTTASQCALSAGTSGCEIQGTKGSYGDEFNAGGGGVYAIEWTSEFIKIWSFARDKIPESITAGTPNSAEFGTPMGNFQGSCNVGDEFQAQRIIINTDFCGDWAGGVFGSSGCPLSDKSDASASCQAYVGSNPSAFADAYWEIKSIKIYEEGSSAVPTSKTVKPAAPTSVKQVGPTSVKPVEPTSVKPVEPTSVKPVEPTTVKPVEPTSVKQGQSTTVSPVDPTTAKLTTTKPAPDTAVTTPESTITTTIHSTTTSTRTVFRSKQSAPVQKPSTTPCPSPSKSTVTVTSFTTPAPAIDASATPSSKLTTTTIVTTSFVDVCPSGYTTKTVMHTVTYCPADATSGGVPPGFTTTAKACPSGCGAGPTTVIVTVPTGTPQEISTAPPAPTSVPASAPASVPASIPTSVVSVPPAPVSVPPVSPPSPSVPVPPANTPSSVVIPAVPSSVAIPSVVTPTVQPSGTTPAANPTFTGASHTQKPFFLTVILGAIVATLFT